MNVLLLIAATAAADPAEIAGVGLPAGLDSLRAAERLYESTDTPTPRHEFAIGLVKLRHTRHSEAAGHLRPLRGDASFLPGWEAALRITAERGDAAGAMAGLPDLAAAIAAAAADAPTSQAADAARRSARAAGRLAGAIDLSDDVPDVDALWLATIERLPSDLQAEFDAGFLDAQRAYDDEVARHRERQRLSAERRRGKLLASAEAQAEVEARAKELSEELKQTGSDYLAAAEEQAGELSDQLVLLDDERVRLESARDTLSELLTILNARVLAERERRRRDGIDDRTVNAQLFGPAGGGALQFGNVRIDPVQMLEAQVLEAASDLAEVGTRLDAVSGDARRIRRAIRGTGADAASRVGAATQRSAELQAKASIAERRQDRFRSQLAELDADASDVVRVSVSAGQLFPWQFEDEAQRID